jgi:cytochrome P450
LPPGNFFRLSPFVSDDREGLVRKATALGPLLTAVSGTRVTICVIGLSTARRLLSEHADDLKPLSIELRPLVPKGFLRTMEGATHQRYRKVFSRAINVSAVASAETVIRDLMAEAVAKITRPGSRDEDRQAIMKSMAAGLLIRIFYGVGPASVYFEELKRNHLKMGPKKFVWKVGPDQTQAFERNRASLNRLLEDSAIDPTSLASGSVMGRLSDAGAVDATTIGNLIYMVEMGRSDLEAFFEWIFYFLRQNPSCLDNVRADASDDSGRTYAEAVVLETLRMEQAERLMRLVKRNFIFDGFLVPKGAVVRISLWEAHKDARVFADPFRFNADRFLENDYGPGHYAPFGLDHHRCPASDMVMEIAKMFVRYHTVTRVR